MPFGASAFPDRAIGILTDAAGQTPPKHIVFVSGNVRTDAQTHTTSVDGFLREQGISRQPDDSLSAAPDAPLTDGLTIVYRAAVPVEIMVDGISRSLRTSAANVGAALAELGTYPGPHDTVVPALGTAVAPNSVVRVTRATSWLERIRTTIGPALKHTYDVGMASGTHRVIDPGSPGSKETTVEVLQPDRAHAPKRIFLASRILRFGRPKVIAEGVADYSTLASVAERGIAGTMRLADAALRMVATAYTAACSGCSGTTASGRPAGHGIVAVDPRFIPLGSHLFIPGYGHALAGDTGGAIRGNRIDLGFDSHRDAMDFGRRPVVVYIMK